KCNKAIKLSGFTRSIWARMCSRNLTGLNLVMLIWRKQKQSQIGRGVVAVTHAQSDSIQALGKSSYTSKVGGFYQLHPLPAFLWFMATLMLTMLLFHPVFLAVSLCASIILNIVQ